MQCSQLCKSCAKHRAIIAEICYTDVMTKKLKEVLERAHEWPEAAQEELAQVALEIESELSGQYLATSEELQAIDEGIAAIRRGEIATDEQVDAVFAKFR